MSFWKKLAKAALVAAPIVAAPFTGGTSLALIGAGAGAAKGALDGGGLKGALMGGALGAIPTGGAGGAAKGATSVAGTGIKGALATAGKQALKSNLGSKAAIAATIASSLGGTLGAMSDSRAAGRDKEAANNLQRDQLGLQGQNSKQNALLAAAQLKERTQADAGDLDLKQKQFSLDRPSQILGNAIKGGAASRMQDVSMNRPKGVPAMSFSGGLRPSLIGSAGREAGAEMERQALGQMMNPDAMAALPSADASVMDQFKPTALPQENALDKLLSAAGTAGGVGTGILNAQDAIKKLLASKIGPAPLPTGPAATAGLQGMPGQQVGLPQVPGAPLAPQYAYDQRFR